MVVDAGYPANTDLVLEGSTPVLKRRKSADRRVGAENLGSGWMACGAGVASPSHDASATP
jgi:hypothetical protein